MDMLYSCLARRSELYYGKWWVQREGSSFLDFHPSHHYSLVQPPVVAVCPLLLSTQSRPTPKSHHLHVLEKSLEAHRLNCWSLRSPDSSSRVTSISRMWGYKRKVTGNKENRLYCCSQRDSSLEEGSYFPVQGLNLATSPPGARG